MKVSISLCSNHHCIVSLFNIRCSSMRVVLAYCLNFILVITNEVEYCFVICHLPNIFCELHTQFLCIYFFGIICLIYFKEYIYLLDTSCKSYSVIYFFILFIGFWWIEFLKFCRVKIINTFCMCVLMCVCMCVFTYI